ncbi:unnamed protein product [Bemisia tabaci]|uniref:Uncharacterized protein n=1 Tax=Bemisia tabaci TaxID=7038 RepID=A0A9P0A7N5_BEMTA|nr:unnamed protein product [Bemisia tabaci]
MHPLLAFPGISRNEKPPSTIYFESWAERRQPGMGWEPLSPSPSHSDGFSWRSATPSPPLSEGEQNAWTPPQSSSLDEGIVLDDEFDDLPKRKKEGTKAKVRVDGEHGDGPPGRARPETSSSAASEVDERKLRNDQRLDSDTAIRPIRLGTQSRFHHSNFEFSY